MPSPSAFGSTARRPPSDVPASPPGTALRTSPDPLSQCACKLRESADQPSLCCSVTNPRPQRAPTSTPTSNSGNGRSTAPPRPAPPGAGTYPKTNYSRSSRPCDYAELRGQVTAPASKNTPARPGPRHNGSIGIIIQRQPRQLLVVGPPVPLAGQRGGGLRGRRVRPVPCGPPGRQHGVRRPFGPCPP